jgi:hypothetical protein
MRKPTRRRSRRSSIRSAPNSTPIPEDKRWLVSSEGAFSYLARDFGLKELYLWPINADQQGTPQQVRKVIDAVRENGIVAVFSESTISDKPARQVARETGAHYGGVLYVDSLTEADGPVPTYLDLLRVTADTIAKGLTEGHLEMTRSTTRRERRPRPAPASGRRGDGDLPQRPDGSARRELRHSRPAPSPRWSA